MALPGAPARLPSLVMEAEERIWPLQHLALGGAGCPCLPGRISPGEAGGSGQVLCHSGDTMGSCAHARPDTTPHGVGHWAIVRDGENNSSCSWWL